MRTTVDLDESVLLAAKAIARDEQLSLGVALSRLVLRGLQQSTAMSSTTGFPVRVSTAAAGSITLQSVNDGRDGE